MKKVMEILWWNKTIKNYGPQDIENKAKIVTIDNTELLKELFNAELKKIFEFLNWNRFFNINRFYFV